MTVRHLTPIINMVLLVKSYKVVDSIRIPSVKFDVEIEDGGKEIEIKKKD